VQQNGLKYGNDYHSGKKIGIFFTRLRVGHKASVHGTCRSVHGSHQTKEGLLTSIYF